MPAKSLLQPPPYSSTRRFTVGPTEYRTQHPGTGLHVASDTWLAPQHPETGLHVAQLGLLRQVARGRLLDQMFDGLLALHDRLDNLVGLRYCGG